MIMNLIVRPTAFSFSHANGALIAPSTLKERTHNCRFLWYPGKSCWLSCANVTDPPNGN